MYKREKEKEGQRNANLEAFIAVVQNSQALKGQSKRKDKKAEVALKKNFAAVSIPPTEHRPGIVVAARSGSGKCAEPNAINALYQIANQKNYIHNGRPLNEIDSSTISLLSTREPCGPELHNCKDHLASKKIDDVTSLVDYNSSIQSDANELSKKIHEQASQKGGKIRSSINYDTYIVPLNGEIQQVGKATQLKRSASFSIKENKETLKLSRSKSTKNISKMKFR